MLVKTYSQRQIFFEGNSLSNNQQNANVAGGHYICVTAYNTLIGLSNKPPLAAFFKAIGGQAQFQINSAFATRIQPYFRSNDIYVQYEGLNDMRSGIDGATAYANLITNLNAVKALGGIFVVVTCPKSDATGDRADLATDVDIYNGLIRTNSSLFDAIADVGADSHFDQVADCANATYYLADKIHHASAGQTIEAGLISTAITPLL